MKAVLAESYEKIHKDHLIGIGIAPLQFLPGENADSLGLSGRETFSLAFPEELSPGVTLTIKVPLRFSSMRLHAVYPARWKLERNDRQLHTSMT